MSTRKRKRKKRKNRGLGLFALVLVAAVSFVSVVAFKAANQPEEPPAGDDSQTASQIQGNPVAQEGGEYAQGVTTFIVGGTDNDGTRTDTLMLVTYDGKTNVANILQIPRDTFVDLPKGNGKINSAYTYGKGELLKSTVSKTFGIPVDYYVVINLKAFRQIVDALDGVEVDVPFAMDYDDPAQDLSIHLKPGVQTLNGQQAEGFVRYRSGYLDADVGRMRAQKAFIAALMDKAISFQTVFKLPQLIPPIMENLKTDIGLGDMIKLAGIALNLDMDQVQVFGLPGEAVNTNVTGVRQWYYGMYRQETIDLLNEHFNLYREPLTEDDVDITELSRENENLYHQDSSSLASVKEDGVKYYPKEK